VVLGFYSYACCIYHYLHDHAKKKCVSNPMHLDQTSLSHTKKKKKKSFGIYLNSLRFVNYHVILVFLQLHIFFFFLKKSFYNLFIKLIKFNNKKIYRLIFQNPFKKLRLV
jgi:hypothetical protein